MNSRQPAILHKDLLLVSQKEVLSSVKGVGVLKHSERALDVIKSSGRNNILLHKLAYRKSKHNNKKATPKKSKFTDWKMPPAPQRYFKSKNNDPL